MTSPQRLPDAQHAWESTFDTDAAGRLLAPRFHRLLMLDVVGEPTPADVEQLENAMRALEGRFSYGPAGLLTCLGWGPGWFERHTTLRPPVGRPLPMARWENPRLEDFDACLHLASDDEDRLTEVTSLLFDPGPMSLRTRLQVREARTGFVGAGLPAARLSGFRVPRRTPLMLGFHSGLRGNQATEEHVTVADGPLAGGTTMHVSYLTLDLDSWYEQSPDMRSALMFSPGISADDAEGLVDDARSNADVLPLSAAVHGIVGHAQAAGRARLHDRPRINRRDFATVDHGSPGTHFVSLQRTMEDFHATRAVMNAADARNHHPHVGARHHNGINSFMEVRSRATFAVPPRRMRAYPYLVQQDSNSTHHEK